MSRVRSYCSKLLACTSMALVSNITAQDALLPLYSASSGLDNPAALTGQPETWSVEIQNAARWSGVNTGFSTQAFAARLRVRPAGVEAQIGLRLVEDRLGPGLSHRSYGVQAAVEQRINHETVVGAGVQLGAARWAWDFANLSWGSQYGATGYDPTAATGEDETLLKGSSLYPDWALGVALVHGIFSTEAALHHGLQSAGLFEARADSIRFRLHQGAEIELPIGPPHAAFGTLVLWQRGDFQGGWRHIEVGAEMRHTFGHNSQYTSNSRSNELGIGLAYQSVGVLRPILSWRGYGGWSVRLGPAISAGPSGASQGWALAIGYAPTAGLVNYPTR